ncbi:MAG: hypothetical protein GMKNLPBB_00821 [Myxococcota bacterium]|nr:hypothetical protein [Myxococcota bacterium]
MNLLELREHVREWIDEPIAAEYSDETIIRFINLAYRELRANYLALDSRVLAAPPVNVTFPAGQHAAALASLHAPLAGAVRIIQIEDISAGAGLPVVVPLADVSRRGSPADETPGYRVFFTGDSLLTDPVPARPLQWRITWVPPFAPLTQDSAAPDIPPDAHDLIALRAAILCRASRDESAEEMREAFRARMQLAERDAGRGRMDAGPVLARDAGPRW